MRTTAGRPAAMLLAALPLLGALLGGCGSAPEAGTGAPTPAAASPTLRCAGPDQRVRVPSYGPSGYADGDLPGDGPPNYAANHAFQQRITLCGDELARATAEAARVKQALARVTEVTAPRVQALLERTLRVDGRLMTVTGSGDLVAFVAESTVPGVTLVVCLDGTVGPDGVQVVAAGPYAEGGCNKPVGGH